MGFWLVSAFAVASGTIVEARKYALASGCVTDPDSLLATRPDLQARGPRLATVKTDVPGVWDWRNVDGQSFVTRTLNQHIPKYCGSCWAHAAFSSYNDRLKILRNASWPDVELSVQYALNCFGKAGTCNGGSDLSLYDLLLKSGSPDETCEVYIAEDEECLPINRCRNCFGPPGHGFCFPQPRYALYKASDYGFFRVKQTGFKVRKDQRQKMIEEMKNEIYNHGPISCVVDAETMFNYTGDYILDNIPGKEVNHVISVAGWGRDDETGIEYWIVRNSWGTYWGDRGWVYIATGKNNAFIESFCSWVKPDWPPVEVVIPPEVAGPTMKTPRFFSSEM